jgi:hypothetical protein
MAIFNDNTVFNYTQQSSMDPCTAPTIEAFEENSSTVVFVNIAGEMRLYSYNGAKIQYQVLQLGTHIDAT